MDADLSGGAACDPVDGAMRPIAEIAVDEPPLSVGSWPPAVRTPCSAAAEQGSVCVEGGAFLLGSAGSVPLEREGFGARPERIVILSPFFLETNEVTVGDYLDLRTMFPEIRQPAQPTDMGLTSFEYCNYRGEADASTREYPLNCVDFELAKEICEKRGMRLPTEAEWEFAAGNATRETTYPWGEDEDICAHAVVARGENYPQQCRNTEDEILPPGSTPSFAADVTDLGIVDLGGNVSEWVADGFEPYGEACWSNAVQTDPSCEATTVRSVRGGNWSLEPATVVVVRRDSARHDARSPAIGFRCAKDG
jgi:formylglycine-generating enzyme required for sulfatase activity